MPFYWRNTLLFPPCNFKSNTGIKITHCENKFQQYRHRGAGDKCQVLISMLHISVCLYISRRHSVWGGLRLACTNRKTEGRTHFSLSGSMYEIISLSRISFTNKCPKEGGVGVGGRKDFHKLKSLLNVWTCLDPNSPNQWKKKKKRNSEKIREILMLLKNY